MKSIKYILFLILILGFSAHSKTNKQSHSSIEKTSKSAEVKKRKPASKAVQRTQAKAGKKTASQKTQPIVLQWAVSHPRNTDQISLVFKQESVDMVTNTTSWQKDGSARLGHFSSRYTKKLATLKEQMEEYYTVWTHTVPASTLINIDGFPIREINPHAPVVSLAGEPVPKNHPYFEALSNIIYSIWKNEWSCVECASYRKRRNLIVRIVETSISHKGGQKKSTTKKVRKTFSKKQLECLPRNEQGGIECVDPEFGIFAL